MAWATAKRRALRRAALHHRGLLVLLGLHALLFAGVVLRASPWATLSLDCVAGTVAHTILGEPAWGPWNVVDGAIGGQVVAGVAALPAYALLGTGNGLVGKLAAWLVSAGLLLLVYGVACRAAGRPAGTLAVAGVAFAPPVVFHTSLIYGNWHWTGLLFDFGAVLLALRIGWPRPPGPDGDPVNPASGWRGHAALAALGLICGLALFNSPRSLPFVGVAALIAAIGLGPRRLLVRLPAGLGGAALGLAPLLLRLGEQASGGAGGKGDVVYGRLLQFRPQPDKLGDLFWPELPTTLHLQELLGFGGLVDGLAVAWVACLWFGCGIAAVGVAVAAVRRTPGRGGGTLALAAPVAFCALFAAAYVVLETRIELLPDALTDIRHHSHRLLSSLLVGMAVGAAGGWILLWRALDRIDAGGLRGGLRTLVVVLALLPAGVGLASQIAMVAQAPGPGLEGLTAFRGACFDVPGFFASDEMDELGLQVRCKELSTEQRRRDCRAGAAWGSGFGAVRLQATRRAYPSDRFRPDGHLCERVPPDQRERCLGWGHGELPGLGPDVETVCAQLGEHERPLCFLGAGWFASQVAWGGPDWPLEACDELRSPADRDACWGGPGFQAADHLASTPDRLRALLLTTPRARQPAVAAGAGYLLGRTWASESVAASTCAQLGDPLVQGCLRGVAAGRRHAVSP
jgi:hypothetical protein